MPRFLASCFFLLTFTAAAFAADGEVVLFDASKAKADWFGKQSSTLTIKNGEMIVEGEVGPWPGFSYGKQHWNLAHCSHLVIDMTNLGTETMTLNCRLDSPEIDHKTMKGTYTQSVEIASGERKLCHIDLPGVVPPQFAGKFFGMRGLPGGAKESDADQADDGPRFHKDAIVSFTLFLNRPDKPSHWSIRKITAIPGAKTMAWMNMTPEKFFPMIDQFGQFKHENWPGKVKSEADLRKNITTEAADLKKHSGPKDRSRYGGDMKTAKREATGHFRVEKIDDAWWLVDPEGYLFWSHGVDCVTTGNGVTGVQDREFYFENLPGKDDPRFKVCYGQGWWAPHSYYQNRTPFTTYNFTSSNLIRKYGDDWKNKFAALAHVRLKSWGMNTIANWSDANIYELKRTPYTVQMGVGGQRIEGSGGYWGKFPDPFSNEFMENLRKGCERQRGTTADDPWCLGYFVDNEISWGDERSLSLASLTSPPTQPSKLAMIEALKKKYGEIGKLNAVWGTDHADWNALLQSTTPPDVAKAKDDLDMFHKAICDQYFRLIRDELKKVAPNKLYLGCRFAWANETAIRSSAEFCDVVSFNKYQRDLKDFALPEGIDMPVVIGEFHFGALDRGMFHTGLQPVRSQAERAAAYETYVRSALAHRNIIGTHWFQYGDQATTGRGDGENYQIGLLTITDTPYPETIEVVRRVGYQLYKIRRETVKAATRSAGN